MLFEEEYDKIDLTTLHDLQHDDITLEAFVHSRGGGVATLATVGVWTRVMLGCEPSELSAAYFFMYCKSQGGLMKMRSGRTDGRYMTIKTGRALQRQMHLLFPADRYSRHTIGCSRPGGIAAMRKYQTANCCKTNCADRGRSRNSHLVRPIIPCAQSYRRHSDAVVCQYYLRSAPVTKQGPTRGFY